MEIDKTGKTAYWCKTKELAEQFLSECDKQSITWASGRSVKEYTNWEDFKEETCYIAPAMLLRYDSREYMSLTEHIIKEFKTEKE